MSDWRWINEIDAERSQPSHEDECVFRLDLQAAIQKLSPSLQRACLDMLRGVPVADKADELRRWRARRELRKYVVVRG